MVIKQKLTPCVLVFLVLVIAFGVQTGCKEKIQESEYARKMLSDRPSKFDTKHVKIFELKINGVDAFVGDPVITENQPVKLTGQFRLLKNVMSPYDYATVHMGRRLIHNGKTNWQPLKSGYQENSITSVNPRERESPIIINADRNGWRIPVGEYETRFFLIIERRSHTNLDVLSVETYLIAEGHMTVVKAQESGKEAVHLK